MGEFQGFEPRLNLQGFTALPNSFFDEVMPNIESLAEMKVLLATFRKTYGWLSHIDEKGQAVYKQQDAISYSQFTELTGLSSPSISSGLSKAMEDGLIIKVEQGNYMGKTSVYKVKIKGENPPLDQGPEPKPEPPTPHRYEGPVAPQTENTPNGLATKDAEMDSEEFDNPADVVDSIFGQGQSEESKPKKQKSTWKSKDRNKWNCNDLLSYYRDLYESTFLQPFGHITGRERAGAKALCEGYGAEVVAKVTEYTFRNYKSIPSLPKEPLAFNIFYGWFKTLYNETHGLTKSEIKTREFDQTKFSDDGGVNSW